MYGNTKLSSMLILLILRFSDCQLRHVILTWIRDVILQLTCGLSITDRVLCFTSLTMIAGLVNGFPSGFGQRFF